jgi:hypothetical protein
MRGDVNDLANEEFIALPVLANRLDLADFETGHRETVGQLIDGKANLDIIA